MPGVKRKSEPGIDIVVLIEENQFVTSINRFLLRTSFCNTSVRALAISPAQFLVYHNLTECCN